MRRPAYRARAESDLPTSVSPLPRSDCSIGYQNSPLARSNAPAGFLIPAVYDTAQSGARLRGIVMRLSPHLPNLSVVLHTRTPARPGSARARRRELRRRALFTAASQSLSRPLLPALCRCDRVVHDQARTARSSRTPPGEPLQLWREPGVVLERLGFRQGVDGRKQSVEPRRGCGGGVFGLDHICRHDMAPGASMSIQS